jgi:hypothetical protein
MGVEHRDLPLTGVQFHPESVLSRHGAHLVRNFLGGGLPGDAGSQSLPMADLPREATVPLHPLGNRPEAPPS